MDEAIYDKVIPTGGKRSRHKRSRHKRSRHKRSRHKRSRHKRSRHKRSRHKQEKRRRRDISRKLGRRHRRRTFRKLYGGAEDNRKRGTRTPEGLGAGWGVQGLGGKVSGKYEDREKMDNEVREWRGAKHGNYSKGWPGLLVSPRRDHRGTHRLDKIPYLSIAQMEAKEEAAAAAANKAAAAAARRSMPPPPSRSASPKSIMSEEQKEFLEGLAAKTADRLRRAQSPRSFDSPPPPPSPGFTFVRSGMPFSPTISGTPKAAFPTENELPRFGPT